jgi:hypothetical protein
MPLEETILQVTALISVTMTDGLMNLARLSLGLDPRFGGLDTLVDTLVLACGRSPAVFRERRGLRARTRPAICGQPRTSPVPA